MKSLLRIGKLLWKFIPNLSTRLAPLYKLLLKSRSIHKHYRLLKNYSQLEKKRLACAFGVKQFHSYLYGHYFTLVTDHKPLLSLPNEPKGVSQQGSAGIQRWALTLSMYEYTLKFKPTTQHANADALSRLPLPETVTPPVSPETVLLLEFQ